MNSKTTISITEARKNIFAIAEEVQKPNNYYTLTQNGRAKAVLMSADEFESWQETMEVMRDFPNLDKDIKEVELAIESGEYKNWITLEELVAEKSFLVADKTTNKYVPVKNQTKRPKRIKKTAAK
jgi:prevent-host-death family protein